MVICKGHKKDGTPCESTIVFENEYCHLHQDQAPGEALRWTRERLEVAVEAHGGPEGLDLAGADLSDLDLCGMDLHGIVLGYIDKSGTPLAADLRKARLWRVNLREAGLWCVDLREAVLWRVDLRKARLMDADLREARLWYANLCGSYLSGANLQKARLMGADLRKVNLKSANLSEADLGGADLERADLRGADLEGANLSGVDLREADLQHVNLREVDLLDVIDGGLMGARLYRARLDHTKLRREQLGSAIWEEWAEEYRKARDTYLALKQNFEDLGDYEAASWAYIKERQMEKKCGAPWRARRFYGREQLGDTDKRKLPAYHPRIWWFHVRHTAKWLSDWLVELVCGYGERPWRTVATMAFVFALFVGIYWATWAVLRVEETSTAIMRRSTRNLVDLAIFGLGAFTTMDPKGLEPAATWVQFLTGVEALLGIGLTGLLGFVLGNRIRRS